jgi:23S rRNA (adenine2030-N6)-methyltransferase
MLSYLHAFHAGNHADVLKHITLTLVLESMVRKDKPFLYVDTHAGAGQYDLHGERATKGREYESGIARIGLQDESTPPAVQSWLHLVRTLNPSGELHRYPGSPWIAQALLRPQDRARLFELHPQECRLLQERFAGNRRVKIEAADGFQALRAVLPPLERRALILVDPSYEVKTDYRTAVQAISAAHRKFHTGVYLLWYPVLTRKQVTRLEEDMVRSGMRNILLAELTIRADTQHTGMTGSGMIVINPPWQLAEALQTVLPWLQRQLAGAGGSHRLRQLVEE